MVATLNLARKWRSKQFQEIVGQELPVRMLQNSLYKDYLFPVYLFSGQRGCGKTTTARIFASALNCEKLPNFKANPKDQPLPCLQCSSCSAMMAGNHPDFIEIDAASYTGVDNVRTIIEAASLLPVLGSKRIYLIDEAHMLSKAAFNAFLKILEEPPASVVFMLATTDPEKILETVRSRCFQLFFTAIDADALVKHLHEVCSVEGIGIEDRALRLIVQETEGSARDALNLLEQVRFSSEMVSYEAVCKVLGHIPESLLLDLFQALVQADGAVVFQLLQSVQEKQYTPLLLWQKLQELLRTLLNCKYGITQSGIYQDKERIITLSQMVSVGEITRQLRVLYDYEMVLLKSTAQEGVIQLMFMALLQEIVSEEKKITKSVPVAHSLSEKVQQEKKIESAPEVQPEAIAVVDVKKEVPAVVAQEESSAWIAFLSSVSQLSDPMLQSIFKQARFVTFDEATHQVHIIFPATAKFYNDWLQETKSIWVPLLTAQFGERAQWTPRFDQKEEKVMAPVKQAVSVATTEQKRTQVITQPQSSASKPSATRQRATTSGVKAAPEKRVDISDKDVWKQANALVEKFGGVVVEVEEIIPTAESETHEETT